MSGGSFGEPPDIAAQHGSLANSAALGWALGWAPQTQCSIGDLTHIMKLQAPSRAGWGLNADQYKLHANNPQDL